MIYLTDACHNPYLLQISNKIFTNSVLLTPLLTSEEREFWTSLSPQEQAFLLTRNPIGSLEYRIQLYTFHKNSGAAAPASDPPPNLPGPGVPPLQLLMSAFNQHYLLPAKGSISSSKTTSSSSSKPKKTLEHKEKKLGNTTWRRIF